MRLLTLKSLFFPLFLLLTFTLSAQQGSEESTEFKIVVEKKGKEVIMQCKSGCAWKELTYEDGKRTQAISQSGVQRASAVALREAGGADFMFTIDQSVNGLTLSTVRGTNWVDLEFSLRDGQRAEITPHGVTRI